MPTSYTSLLGLALPVTGELSGTWGDTVNDYITQYLDGAVAGTQTISGSQTAVTLSKTTAGALAQVGSGATGSSQYSIINCTGNPGGLLTITAPAASKPYIVINATSTNQSVKIVGTGPTTGVTLVAGEKAVVAWNGSDFTKIATSTADGVTTIDFGTTGLTPATATSGAVTVAGTLVVGNGGTGLTSGTSGGVPYFSASNTIASSAALTAGALVTGGGAGVAPATITTGTGVTTALGVNTGSAGAFVVNGGALGTPASGTLTNATGLPLSTGVTGTLPVANGGTGTTSLTSNNVILGNGTSAVQFVAPGTNGNVLTSNGTTWTSAALPAGGLTYIFTTTPITLADKQGALTDTSGGSFTVTLPATPATGAQVVVADAGSNWGTNNLTVGRNGSTIGGLAENLVCDITGASVQLVYDGTTWEVYAQIGGNGGNAATQPGNNNFTGANTFYNSSGQVFGTGTSTQDGIILAGRAGGSSSFRVTMQPATLAANRTATLPDAGANYTLGFINIPQSGSAKTGSYTLATSDVGEFIQISTGGSIVIPNSTFAAGDVVSLFNNTSGTITITCSTSNAYIAGTDSNKASMTLAARGVATVLFITSTLCVVTGNVT